MTPSRSARSLAYLVSCAVLAATIITAWTRAAQSETGESSLDALITEQRSWLVESDTDLRALADDLSDQMRMLVPPGASLWQPASIEPVPVIVSNLPWLAQATWSDSFSVPTAWLGLYELEDGDVQVIDNGGWGKLLTTLPPPDGYEPWAKRLGEDAGTLLHQVRLVDDGDLAQYFYTKSAVEQYAASQSESEDEGGGVMMLISGGNCTEIVFTAVEIATNMDMVDVGLCFPDGITNADIFACTNLMPEGFPWNLAATNLPVTTNSVVWSWTNLVETNVFLAAGDGSLTTGDQDNDAMQDAREFFLYGTDRTKYDSDGDGLSDGWEIQYGFDPLLDVTTDLRAWYELEETNGTNVSDSWIFSAEGQLLGSSAPMSQTGAVGKAFRFDGTDDGVRIPNVSALDIQPEITLAAWIWPATNIFGSRQSIIQKNSDYYFNTRDGKLQFFWYQLSTNVAYWAPTNILQTGAWSHVAATFNGTDVSMYINGVQVLSSNASVVGNITNTDVGIGYGFGDGRYWNGMLDEVRIYSRGLSSNQLQSLWYAGADLDADGLRNVMESQYRTNPNDADTDDDTLTDGDEVFIYGTDPAVSNVLASVSGSVTYKGSSTGQVVVLASPEKFSWTSPFRQTLPQPGAFALTNVPAGTSYWIKAFRDLNSNGVWEGKEPPYFCITNIELAASGATNINVHVEKLRGMRVDFGEYYNGQWAGKSTEQIAGLIVSNAADWGVNTLYARAMTPNSTYWPNPTNLYLRHEGGHGAAGILTNVIAKAHARGIKVIGWIQPVLANSSAWSNNPSWRFKLHSGADYEPTKYLLSPFNSNVLSWLDGVIAESLSTGVDGLDFSETFYDRFDTDLNDTATYDTAATNLFFSRYPGGSLGDSNWWKLRRDILTTNVYQRLGRHIVASGRELHVTFNWAAQSSGLAHLEPVVAENTGFSFNDVLNQTADSRPDVISPEFIWQKEAFLHTNTYPAIFNPEWTIVMATQFVSFVDGRAIPSFHPEITTKLVGTNRLPSLQQFESTLRYALTNVAAMDFFVHHLAFTNNYLLNGTNATSYGFVAVSNVFTTTE